MNINTILQNKNFKLKEKNLPNSFILSLATAYTQKINEDFNLLRKELTISNFSLLKKQMIASLILILAIFLIVFGYSQRQINKLVTENNNAAKETINVLRNTFGITDRASLINLSTAIPAAKTKVDEEEAIWFSFSQGARFSFLKYLQELSSLIERDSIGLNLKKLTMTHDLITLEGEVRDFKALENLENALSESKLFSHVSVPQETKFTIKITIKKNGDLNETV